MTQSIFTNRKTSISLKGDLGLETVHDPKFFWEWESDLVEVSDAEKLFLDNVRETYINWVEDPLLPDKPVQIGFLGPILSLGGFFLPPFQFKRENSIEFQLEDEGIPIWGCLDVLRLTSRFWVMAIESQRFSFSSHAGEVELLTHIQSELQVGETGYGLVVTGGQSIFFKLVKGTISNYAFSNSFATWNQENGLYDVFKILKRISQL